MVSIFDNINIDLPKQAEPLQEVPKAKPYQKILHNLGLIALKALAISGMAIGVALAIGGGIALTKIVILSGAAAPIFTIGALFGEVMVELSLNLLTSPLAIFTIITFPIAAISYGLPFTGPFIVGALPGIGLIALSVWSWEKLSGKPII